ncbi:uncharacterized protein LY89DRAFT_239181 [Mollisia scopiformis]|uniref:Uncharacterized protein n=1 Tax=Mollisia scopiformis TaxID=149040 RepID=A0A194WT98_MOLSC|nr:uncharacterized protein LY89DRAFT_239181 [Mollisia scopiformis]KUJ11180.1 hypothetical protein LY89DRAFT_239181 [Mollisia scopiformis]
MPSLTLDTTTSPHTQEHGQTQSTSRSASPVRAPPYSPITPTLSTARPIFTHTSQPPPAPIPQPPPETIDFSTNPDVLALKATMSILQQQKKTAEQDMKLLADTKERALRDPERFATALTEGRIHTRGDTLFNPSNEADSDEEMEDADDLGQIESGRQAVARATNEEKWKPLPTPQNVVRMPAVNWEQYGVVGDSLEKIHKDQIARPNEGIPQKMGPDGKFQAGSEGQRRDYLGIAAPYNPLKDKIEKSGTKKSGKR